MAVPFFQESSLERFNLKSYCFPPLILVVVADARMQFLAFLVGLTPAHRLNDLDLAREKQENMSSDKILG